MEFQSKNDRKMNTKITFLHLFAILFLLILIFACKNDDDASDGDVTGIPEFYVEDELVICPSKIINLSNVSFQINRAYEFENLIIGGGFNDMVIFNPATENLIEIDTIGVNQFLEYDGKLMICAKEGLYSFDSQQNLTLETDERCHSVHLSTNGTFLMTGTDKRILSWNSTQGLTPYTDSHLTNFIDMFNLIELNNGELWTITGNGKIARFKDQLFFDFYDADDLPINESVLEVPMFMSAYEEGAILVAKNGFAYQIFKYTNNQEWVTLFDSVNTPDSDETTAIVLPSITGIIINEDKLYISTTLASCKGFQVFEISKNELLSSEDYYPQFDTNFDSHCVHGLVYGSNGDIFTIADNQVLIYDCN